MIRSNISVNSWRQELPTVDAVRPAACVVCGAAGRPVGGRLGLLGHGLRERQCRGPMVAGGVPMVLPISARRYRCQHCPAVLIVVPREMLPRRQYAATAIALALVLYGVRGQPHAQVRAAVSSDRYIGTFAQRRWCTLARWIDAAAARRLFPELPVLPRDAGRRAVAQRAAMAIGAHAPPSITERAPELRAFLGVAHMA